MSVGFFWLHEASLVVPPKTPEITTQMANMFTNTRPCHHLNLRTGLVLLPSWGASPHESLARR